MSRMIFILAFLISMFGACKSDNNQNEKITDEKVTVNDTQQPETVSKDTLVQESISQDKPKSVPKPKEEIQSDDVTSVPVETKQDRTKSVPKQEPEETKGTLEQVPVDGKPKSVPKPEPEVVNDVVNEVPVAKSVLDHSAWNTLLSQHVNSAGVVNYKGFKRDIDKLNNYLTKLESVDVADLNRNEKLAFWINAYNAYTVKKIIDNYPVSSITNLDGGKPWDVKWIKLDGRTLSLNNIENDIIRPEFNEPRIHFAVNCAAKSCPPLLNKAWTASNLEKYFEIQAKSFINNSKYNNIKSNSIEVSKIFEWYAGDFGDLITYLNKYSNTKIKANASVSYKEYDWALNE